MNFFDNINSVRKPNSITIVRRERIRREGSQPFNWNVPATAAGATAFIDIQKQFPEAGKYMPLDKARIVNNDAIDITVMVNGNKDTYYIPAGTITTLANVALRSIAVRNDDTVATSVLNKIRITMEREPETADSLARRMSALGLARE